MVVVCRRLVFSLSSIFNHDPDHSGRMLFLPHRTGGYPIPSGTPGTDEVQRFPTPGLLLKFPSSGKNDCRVEYKQAVWEEDAGQLEIRLPKEPYVPCLAYPVTEAGKLKPAGGITEADGTACLHLSWEDGFTAEVLLQLFVETETYGSINIPRLVREIRETAVKEDGAGTDPWRLDKLPILLGLGYGSFSSHRIRELDTRSLELPLDQGTWFWDNPMKKSFQAPGYGLIRLEDVPLGSHTLIPSRRSGIRFPAYYSEGMVRDVSAHGRV